jgi:diadenylate cyclase
MIERLAKLYESMTTRDGIQIAILAVVIYAVWRFLGKTCGSGSSIGRGLGLVVLGLFLLAQVVVASLDMTELSIVLDYLLTTFLVGMLIIFQPELRRGLMMLGQSRLWHFFDGEEKSIAEQLAEAAECMSKEFVGALIVIEREVDLRALCETGEPIDAAVSGSLLRTLFTPRSPLHDGAVIIRKGRIAAAACQLPLRVRDQQTQDIGGYHMGMRHRAALCTSEETDAVLLVVSEETGRISVAVAGDLEPVPREHLAARLEDYLQSSHTQKRRKTGDLSRPDGSESLTALIAQQKST